MAQLARRVRWFDAYRHHLAFGITAAFALFGWLILPAILGPDWPVVFVRFLALGACMFVGIGVEVVFASALAFWEVEHDRLINERGLPKAQLLCRRKSSTLSP